ncbi:hypothetical protein [Catenovulum agarivorans]|uniref:hypothetical protein n=1 Tax=Catenovulum agarivorans TaxID=1172192 RepID=UPI000300157B|nr:hypothetical protein [Catenovulum agarivorans]
MRKVLSFLFGLAMLIGIAWGGYWIISQIWAQFKSLDSKIALAAITAFTTVTVSTLTVVLGKYYERKKDIEAHLILQNAELFLQMAKKNPKVTLDDLAKKEKELGLNG